VRLRGIEFDHRKRNGLRREWCSTRKPFLPRRPGIGRTDAGGLADHRTGHLPIHASWLNQIEIYFTTAAW